MVESSLARVAVSCRLRPALEPGLRLAKWELTEKSVILPTPQRSMSKEEFGLSSSSGALAGGKLGNRAGPATENVTETSMEHVFGPCADTQEVYETSYRGIVEKAVQGLNGCIMAYGQTSSGKTYSMMGSSATAAAPSSAGGSSEEVLATASSAEQVGTTTPAAPSSSSSSPSSSAQNSARSGGRAPSTTNDRSKSKRGGGGSHSKGIIELALEDAFAMIEGSKSRVRFSLCEIYMEKVIDLLATRSRTGDVALSVKECPRTACGGSETAFYVEGLSEHDAWEASDVIEKILAAERKRRKIAQTKYNEQSSRSHTVLTLTIEVADGGAAAAAASSSSPPAPTTRGEQEDAGVDTTRVGKLVFVDLAGNEKLDEGMQYLQEGSAINLSLFFLGECISKLSDASSSTALLPPTSNTSYIPYRDSKLTRILAVHLGQNSHTGILVCLHPAEKFTEQSIQTLRFAQKASLVVSRVRPVYRSRAEELLQKLRQRVRVLEEELEDARVAQVKERASIADKKGESDGSPGAGGGVVVSDSRETDRIVLALNQANTNYKILLARYRNFLRHVETETAKREDAGGGAGSSSSSSSSSSTDHTTKRFSDLAALDRVTKKFENLLRGFDGVMLRTQDVSQLAHSAISDMKISDNMKIGGEVLTTAGTTFYAAGSTSQTSGTTSARCTTTMLPRGAAEDLLLHGGTTTTTTTSMNSSTFDAFKTGGAVRGHQRHDELLQDHDASRLAQRVALLEKQLAAAENIKNRAASSGSPAKTTSGTSGAVPSTAHQQDLKVANTQLRSLNKYLASEKDKHKADCEKLRQKANADESKIAECEARITSLLAAEKLRNVGGEDEAAARRTTDYTKTVEPVETEVESDPASAPLPAAAMKYYQEEIAVLRLEREALEEDLAQREREASDVREKLGSVMAARRDSDRQVSKLENEIKTLTEDNVALRHQSALHLAKLTGGAAKSSASASTGPTPGGPAAIGAAPVISAGGFVSASSRTSAPVHESMQKKNAELLKQNEALVGEGKKFQDLVQQLQKRLEKENTQVRQKENEIARMRQELAEVRKALLLARKEQDVAGVSSSTATGPSGGATATSAGAPQFQTADPNRTRKKTSYLVGGGRAGPTTSVATTTYEQHEAQLSEAADLQELLNLASNSRRPSGDFLSSGYSSARDVLSDASSSRRGGQQAAMAGNKVHLQNSGRHQLVNHIMLGAGGAAGNVTNKQSTRAGPSNPLVPLQNINYVYKKGEVDVASSSLAASCRRTEQAAEAVARASLMVLPSPSLATDLHGER